MENLFKVSAHSRSVSLAGAIAGSIREGKSVVLQAIGAGSVNQAVKAIVVARNFLAGDGLDVICVPAFVALEIDGQERTAVRFHLDQPGSSFPPASAFSLREAAPDAPTGEGAGSHNGV